MNTTVKEAVVGRGDMVNNANAKMERWRNLLYPVALATAGGVGLGGLDQLYKYFLYDKYEPEEPDPGVVPVSDEEEEVRRLRRGSGSAWKKLAGELPSTDAKQAPAPSDYDTLTLPQRLLIDRQEYNNAPPGMSQPLHESVSPDLWGNVAVAGGALGGVTLGYFALKNYLQSRRVRRSREQAMLAEIKLRAEADKMQRKRALTETQPEQPGVIERFVAPIGSLGLGLTLASAGAGGLFGAMLTRNMFRDNARERHAEKIKKIMGDKRRKERQDMLFDTLSSSGDSVKEAARGTRPFAKTSGLADVVLGHLDTAYNKADQVTRHKMTDEFVDIGNNMGAAGGRIRAGMSRIADNPGFRKGLTDHMTGALGATSGTNKGAGFDDIISGVVGKGKDLLQKAQDGVGTVMGTVDGPTIAKQVAGSIPGQVADRVESFASRVNSTPEVAEQVGREAASGKLKFAAAAPVGTNNVASGNSAQEYQEDVAGGVEHGIKSSVGGQMPNRVAGMAVNFAIHPSLGWLRSLASGAAGLFGQLSNMGSWFGSNARQQPSGGQAKAAAGNAPMSHAFRRAGESIGRSPEMTQPLAKALNDSVVPDTVKSVTNRYLPQGSYMGFGDSLGNIINNLFAPGKSAALYLRSAHGL